MFRFKVVANMVRSLREGQELFAKLTRVTDRWWIPPWSWWPACPRHQPAGRGAKQKLIVEAFPKSLPPLAFRALANKAASWPIPNQPGGHLQFFLENLLQSRS